MTKYYTSRSRWGLLDVGRAGVHSILVMSTKSMTSEVYSLFFYYTSCSFLGYQPGERSNHSTVRVGDNLYMWGGFQTDFPEVHNSHEKKLKSSVVEVYHLPTGRWEQKPTTGNPPLGIHGYASAAIGNEIFYFGGDCNHQGCYHNSLHSFNVKTLRWKELSPTTSHHGPMMKRDAGMVAMRIDGEDYLVVIGGWGLSYNNTPAQPEAEYRGLDQVPDLQHCNEIHYYKLSSGQLSNLNSFSHYKLSINYSLLFLIVQVNGFHH